MCLFIPQQKVGGCELLFVDNRLKGGKHKRQETITIYYAK